MQRALARYRGIQKKGGFTTISSGPVMEPGLLDERMPQVRKRLYEEGYLIAASGGNLYDEMVSNAIKSSGHRVVWKSMPILARERFRQ
ncbi:MAG: hypothetical protein H6908_03675 [Hyphomicrobiales bacterium]|nr:hypothetical protein [Hyphomicrobiales bacterium]